MAGNSLLYLQNPYFRRKEIRMRKIGILFITVFCLFACKSNSTQIGLEGELKGLTNDTLYLYGTDALYDRIDTIYAQEGKFSYNLNVDSTVIDTLTATVLLINGNVEYPLFLDKGNQIKIKGNANDLSHLDIDGNEPNTSLSLFMREQKSLGQASNKMMQEGAETFIRQHNSSLASIYLLDKYFVQIPQPDYTKIKEITESMTGALLDRPYIENISDYIDQLEKVTVGKSAPYFSLPNKKGEKLSRSAEKFRDKYLLLNFWASWCDQPSEANTELKKLNKEYKRNKNFAILGISLDIDKKAWETAISKDSLNWEQVCDFTGLSSETAKQYAILTLPTNILISPTGRILARDIKGEALTNKLKELLKTEEKKSGRTKR